jgi:hypothetical protein
MGAFVVAAALIVGFIAWRANDLLTNKVVETLEAEVTGLREQFQAGGAERLAAVIAQRAGEPGSGLYLLVDATGRKVAGNLDRVPPEFAGADGGSVFNYVRTAPTRRGTVSRLAVGVPLPVPGGLMLIVGRDIEDLHRFAGTMGQLGLWSIALLSILGHGEVAMAYTEATHRILTDQAYSASKVGGPALWTQLGLDETASTKVFPGSGWLKKTARDLMVDGAEYEDSGVRSVNHFFNPLNGTGLLNGHGQPAPDWALEDQGSMAHQPWSFKDAREAFFNGLTAASPSSRR